MRLRSMLALPVVLLAGACSTYVTPRYSMVADTHVTLKTLGVTGIGVGPFTGPASFDNSCRAAGPLSPPDGMTHTEYLRKALEDELKFAGAHGAGNPRVVLSGVVNKLEFSSTRGLTGGSWDVDLTVSSNNGRKMSISEHYEFHAGHIGDTACKNTAEAYMPAVQNLIRKLAHSPEFKALVQ